MDDERTCANTEQSQALSCDKSRFRFAVGRHGGLRSSGQDVPGRDWALEATVQTCPEAPAEVHAPVLMPLSCNSWLAFLSRVHDFVSVVDKSGQISPMHPHVVMEHVGVSLMSSSISYKVMR